MPTYYCRSLGPGLLCVAAMLSVTASGCGTSSPTVTGTVSVGSQPLENGSIDFYPIEDTPGGSTGAEIKNGRFEISKGLTVGKYRIAIEGTRPDPDGEMIKMDFSDQLTPKPVQVVPKVYRGQESPLVETVETGPQNFTFELSEISVNKRGR